MMTAEEAWLRSQTKLCELRLGLQAPAPEHTKEVVFSCHSCPQPTFSKGSILSSLQEYASILRVEEKKVGPSTESSTWEVKGCVIQEFAKSLAENILQSSSLHWQMGSKTEMGGSCDPRSPIPGLPSEGSIDYPTAPPTSPLHPNIVPNSSDFPRDLKGVLARGFQPRPPPPTPAYHVQPSQGEAEEKEEFVAQLMSSLSLECAHRSGYGAEQTGLVGYATRLAVDIISCVCTSRPAREQSWSPGEGSGCLHQAAERLAGDMLVCALQSMAATPRKSGRSLDMTPPKSGFTENVEMFAWELVAGALQQLGICDIPTSQSSYREPGEAGLRSPGDPVKQQHTLVRVLLDRPGQGQQVVCTLQGLLLWAAVSQMERATLQLPLEVPLLSQFFSLAQRAQQIGWTVGDLVTSLVHICGGCCNDDMSLLQCLYKQLGNAP